MSTLAELNTHRTDAGAAYVAAYAAFRAAFIDLAALDRTLANGKVKGIPELRAQSFHSDRLELVSAFRTLAHNQFLPSVNGNMESEIVAAEEARLAAFPTPD